MKNGDKSPFIVDFPMKNGDKSPFIVDFPIKNGDKSPFIVDFHGFSHEKWVDFPVRYVKVYQRVSWNILSVHVVFGHLFGHL